MDNTTGVIIWSAVVLVAILIPFLIPCLVWTIIYAGDQLCKIWKEYENDRR